MMKTKYILLAIVFITMIASNTNAQIGNLNKLKNKAKNIKTKKSSSSSNNTALGKSKYQKYMDEGAKYKKEGNNIEAYKSYKKALEEKPGDYSAKNQLQYIKSDLIQDFEKTVKGNIEKGNCDEATKHLNQAAEIGVYTQRDVDYYSKEIEKCKASASANAASSANKAKVDALADGSANFYTDFATKNFSDKVSIGDDLFVKFKFAKVMTDYFSNFGMAPAHNAYGYFTVYINGKKIFTDGPYLFTSNYSKVWKDFDVPLSVSKEFLTKLKSNPKMMSTSQDIWLLQQLPNPTGIKSKYIMAAIQNMSKDGTYKLKIEFGLGEKSDGKPKGTIASGEVNIISDAAGRKELYKRGPKYLQPIEENERGKFTFTPNTYELGNGVLKVTLELPNPPKYYNMKWCQSMSCDYDHGEILFSVYLDGKFLAAWQPTFWHEEYEKQKSFSGIMFPTSDKGLSSDLADFNSSVFFKKVGDDNPLVYALFDLIYANKLPVGKHTLSFRSIAKESIPQNLSEEQEKEFYQNVTNAIAKNDVTINVTPTTRSKLIANSSAQKLKHRGGSWASVDAHLKQSETFNSATILDVPHIPIGR